MSPQAQPALDPRTRIFISYRRDDAGGHARALYQALNARLPRSLFFDLGENAILPGQAFLDRISGELRRCDVIIVVIGRNWSSIGDATNRPRLYDPEDVVRFEIRTAISHHLQVIPVLLEGAKMPSKAEIPEDLHPVLAANAVVISENNYDRDVEQLSVTLKRELDAIRVNHLENEIDVAIQSEDWESARQLLVVALKLDRNRPSLHEKSRLIRTKGGMTRRPVVAGVASFLSLAAVGGAFLKFKPSDSLAPVAPLSDWRAKILSTQANNGGFHVHTVDVTQPTQVFTTAQGLKGVLESVSIADATQLPAADIRRAVDYMESLRSPSKLTESKEEGWALSEDKSFTLTEIAAWVTLANIASVDTPGIWDAQSRPARMARMHRDLAYIAARRAQNGGWGPISKITNEFTRTYSTILALWAFVEAETSPTVGKELNGQYDRIINDGVKWLQSAFNEKLGWVPNPNQKNQTDSYLGLTAQTLFVLDRITRRIDGLRQQDWLKQAKLAFLKSDFTIPVSFNRQVPDGEQSFPGTPYMAEATTFLWYPWSVAVLRMLSQDDSLPAEKQATAKALLQKLSARLPEEQKELESAWTYQVAENLFAFSYPRH